MASHKLGNRGVTLLEIIVTFVIIATTAAMAIPNLEKGAAKKRADQAIAALRKISYCVRLYQQEHGWTIPTIPVGANTFEALYSDAAIGNRCYDYVSTVAGYNFSTMMGPTKTIPSPNATWALSAINSTDKRAVCIQVIHDATNRSRSGTVYDYHSTESSCGAANNYRSFAE